ncbi:hypothetical protein VULLAG_LOCUS4660 [Vulpes lagopus]
MGSRHLETQQPHALPPAGRGPRTWGLWTRVHDPGPGNTATASALSLCLSLLFRPPPPHSFLGLQVYANPFWNQSPPPPQVHPALWVSHSWASFSPLQTLFQLGTPVCLLGWHLVLVTVREREQVAVEGKGDEDRMPPPGPADREQRGMGLGALKETPVTPAAHLLQPPS